MYSLPIVYRGKEGLESFHVTLTDAGVHELQKLLENPAFAIVNNTPSQSSIKKLT